MSYKAAFFVCGSVAESYEFCIIVVGQLLVPNANLFEDFYIINFRCFKSTAIIS